MISFGKREQQISNWFEAGIKDMEPAIAAESEALVNCKRAACDKALAALRKTRSGAKQIAR